MNKLAEFLGLAPLPEQIVKQCEQEIAEYQKPLPYGGGSAGIYNAHYGKKHSEQTKKIIGEYAKGNNRRLGKSFTDSSKRKMSETRKNKNLKWYNDGKISKMVSEAPENWKLGRLPGVWGRSKK